MQMPRGPCSLRDGMRDSDAEPVVQMAVKTCKCVGCSWRRRVGHNLGRLPGGGGRGAECHR